MFNSSSFVHTARLLALVLAAGLFSGCASKQEKALKQAMNQAAKTGQAQRVVSIDKHGVTTTTVVQPPVAGQTEEAMTTTVIPPAAGTPAPKPLNPTVSAVPQPPPEPEKVDIPAGTRLTIRVDQRISVKHSRPGETFTGEIVIPVLGDDKTVLVPKGSPVTGVVDVARRRGRFKGRSELELRLTSLSANGTTYRLNTRDLEETKKGKGKRSAAMIGGGSGVGMLVGGLASGGVGLAVGGLVGGGAGTATAALTGNRDIVIPAESIVHFTMASDLLVQLSSNTNGTSNMAQPSGD
ncbi:MAG: hypothetical protein ACLQLH_10625 [Terracidiphilus sp.]